MPEKLKSRFLNEITSRQAAAVMARNSTVILPVGTVEMHGPHMPMGCDGFIAVAFAKLLAERIDCLIAPQEPYSYIGATSKFPGGVSVSYSTSIDFTKHIVRGLIASGFAKVIIVSFHYPNRTSMNVVVRDLFEETGVPVININPDVAFKEELIREILGDVDDPAVEAALLAGALKILGKLDLIDPHAWTDETFVPVEPESLRRLQRMGAVGYYFRTEMTHQPPRAGIDPDRGAEILTRAVDSVESISRDLDEYIRFLEKHPPEISY